MKLLALASALTLSMGAHAVPAIGQKPIISPTRDTRINKNIVTPNEPTTGTGSEDDSQQPTEMPFPGQANSVAIGVDQDGLTEYDPEDGNIVPYLNSVDEALKAQGYNPYPAGKSADLGSEGGLIWQAAGGDCSRSSCKLWIVIDKATQTVNIYVNQNGIKREVKFSDHRVSSGLAGQPVYKVIRGRRKLVKYTKETPDFDQHPNGRIFTKFSSTEYPGGDWNGLGNMPYAVFISGGYAVHGTPSIGRLGHKASHGCVRMNPATAKIFNGLARRFGAWNTWVTVQ